MKRSLLKWQGYEKNKSLENTINLQRAREKDMIREHNALSVGWGGNSLCTRPWYVSLRTCVLTIAPMLKAHKPVYACVPKTGEQRQRSLTTSLISQPSWNGNLMVQWQTLLQGIKEENNALCFLPHSTGTCLGMCTDMVISMHQSHTYHPQSQKW